MALDNQYGRESILLATPSLLSAKRVVTILGISAKTVHRLVREGKLACVQVTSATGGSPPGRICLATGAGGSRPIIQCPSCKT